MLKFDECVLANIRRNQVEIKVALAIGSIFGGLFLFKFADKVIIQIGPTNVTKTDDSKNTGYISRLPCMIVCNNKIVMDFWSSDPKLNPSGQIATTGKICKQLRETYGPIVQRQC